MAGSINGTSFVGWKGSLAGSNPAADETPCAIETQSVFADDAAAYAALATWRSWPSATTTRTVVMPDGTTITGCLIYEVQPVSLIACRVGVLLSARWSIVRPESV